MIVSLDRLTGKIAGGINGKDLKIFQNLVKTHGKEQKLNYSYSGGNHFYSHFRSIF